MKTSPPNHKNETKMVATENITDIFQQVLRLSGSVDMAEADFKRMIHEDPELREQYRTWCHEVGSTEKRGFLDFCDEYLDDVNSVWDTLSDYSDE